MKKWGHDELAADLAKHLRGNSDRMVWCDMQLGPSGSERPDVYTMQKSYSKPHPIAYECKISVADFRSDITSGKWMKYYEEAGAVIFAVPEGLVTKADIPKGAGLIVRHENCWRTAKGPTFQRVTLSVPCLQKLLIDGVRRLPRSIGPRELNIYRAAKKIREKTGKDVAAYLSDVERAAHNLQKLKDDAKTASEILRNLEKEQDNLLEVTRQRALKNLDGDAQYIGHEIAQIKRACGIAIDADHYTFRKKLMDIRAMIKEDDRLSVAIKALEDSKSAVERAIKDLSD